MVTVLLLVLLAYTVSAAPVKYDQRQEGDFNVHAHLENFVIVLLPSSGVNLLDFTAKAVSNRKDHPLLQNSEVEDSNKIIVNKFVSPSSSDGTKLSSPDFPARKSPYKVDIDKKNCDTTEENDKEVLIAHPPSSSPQPSEAHPDTTITTLSATVETTQVPKVVSTEEKQNSPGSSDDSNEKLKDKLSSTIEVPKTPLSEKKDTIISESVASTSKETAAGEDSDKVISGSKHRDNSKHGTVQENSKKQESEKTVSQAKPKAIDFDAAQERSTSAVQKSYEDQVPVLEFSQFLKAINGAADKIDSQERLLSSGLEECGPGWRRDKLGRCEQIAPKQRSLLSALQYGISPAN